MCQRYQRGNGKKVSFLNNRIQEIAKKIPKARLIFGMFLRRKYGKTDRN